MRNGKQLYFVFFLNFCLISISKIFFFFFFLKKTGTNVRGYICIVPSYLFI